MSVRSPLRTQDCNEQVSAKLLYECGIIKHAHPKNVYFKAIREDWRHDLWFKKQREAAAAHIPDELVLKTNLIGTEEMVRERLHIHQRAGVNTLHVNPDGQTLDERLATLGRLVELVREVNAEKVSLS